LKPLIEIGAQQVATTAFIRKKFDNLDRSNGARFERRFKL